MPDSFPKETVVQRDIFSNIYKYYIDYVFFPVKQSYL